jgi:hypothetical protein
MRFETLTLNKALVVEFSEIELPKPDIIEMYYNPIYDIQYATGKRYMHRLNNRSEIDTFFTLLCWDTVYPALVSTPTFRNEYPFNVEFLKKNTKVGVELIRDQIGYAQGFHFDNRGYVLAGSFHLKDSPLNGTRIYGETHEDRPTPIFATPSLENTGAFWVNNMFSGHSVDPVKDTDRFFYLVHVLWNLDYSVYEPSEIRQYDDDLI